MNTNINPSVLGEIIGNCPKINEKVSYLESDSVKAIEEVMNNNELTEEQKSTIISYIKTSKKDNFIKPTINILNENLV